MSNTEHDLLQSLGTAIMVTTAAWGMTTVLTFSYYRKFPKDYVVMKILVGLIWAFYTTFLVCLAYGFRQLMVAVGPSVGEIPLMINVGSVFASFVQCTVQAIYAQRIYRLSRSLLIPIGCWIVILYNLCAGIAYSMVVTNKSPEEFIRLEQKLHWLLITWYSAMGVVDMVITVTLCCVLLRLRRSSRCNSQRAMNILDTVVLWTIQTGMVTSLLAVAVVVVYCSVSSPGAWIALTLGITSAYALSLVTLLNGRSLLLNHPSNQGDVTALATLTIPEFSVATDSSGSQVTGDRKDGLV